jgi:phenylacetate-CoA ligase
LSSDALSQGAQDRKGHEMSSYEALRQRHLADAMALAPHLIERLDWPAERMAAHRSEQLRELVRYAVAHSRWHRSRLEGVDADQLDATSLRELPVMTKTDLMEHFDEIVTDERLSLELVNAHLDKVESSGYLLDRYSAVTSGGSSGERGVFVYDWEGWIVFGLSCLRHLLRAKQSDPELAFRPLKLAWVMAGHFTHATAAIGRTFAGPAVTTVRLPVTLPTEQIVAGLNAAQPDALNAYPTALHVLSFEARAGRLRISPRLVQSAAEPLLPEIRAAAEAAWGVRVGNLYGTSEGGGTAVPCEHRRTHLSQDLVIVEPVDENGQPVPPGERSAKIYLTNLYNRALPLIRYEITDEVTILREPCECGSSAPCFADIQGRLDDTFLYNGRPIHPLVFATALGRRAGISEYQVRQTPSGAAITLRCQGPVDFDHLAAEIEQGLAQLGLEHPEVTLTTVERLERVDGPAKLKRYVPLSAIGALARPSHTADDTHSASAAATLPTPV